MIYAQMLAATERIIVGPFVTNPATRDPRVTASLFATLNEGFGNRTICGIGRGDSARRVLGRKPTTLAETETRSHVIKELAEGRAIETPAGEVRDPVGAGRQARRLDGRLRAEGARAGRPQGRRVHPPARRPGDPRVDGRARTRGRGGGGPRPGLLAVCVAAPAYLGDDLAHARDQCRWFGGMVGNHVADLVRRYGERRRDPHGADRLHPRPRGLRLQPPRARRQPATRSSSRTRSSTASACLGPPRTTSRSCASWSRSASTSSTSTSCTTRRRRRSTATAPR